MSIPYAPHWEADELLAMPFDQYQRYRLTAELVLALKQAAGATEQPWRILDVGGYYRDITGRSRLPLTEFLTQEQVLALDVADYSHPSYQRGSGTDLPFPDRSFDVVTTCDTLEHIPRAGRGAFLAELRRVARQAVVLAAPHATAGVSASERALDEYLRSFGVVHDMLAEHLQYGIPEPEWVDGCLREQGADFVAFASGYLPRWLLLMLLKHQLILLPQPTVELHQRLDQLYNARFYERDQRGPGYRRVYVIAAAGALPSALQSFVERAARPEPADAGLELLGIAVAPLIRALSQLSQLQGSLVLLEQQLRQLAAGQAALQTASQQAQYSAGVLEGEKRVLQQQLELLRWQNELLHTQLRERSPLGLLRRGLDLGARLLGLGRSR